MPVICVKVCVICEAGGCRARALSRMRGASCPAGTRLARRLTRQAAATLISLVEWEKRRYEQGELATAQAKSLGNDLGSKLPNANQLGSKAKSAVRAFSSIPSATCRCCSLILETAVSCC